MAAVEVEEELVEHVAVVEHFVVVDHVAFAEGVAVVELECSTVVCCPCSLEIADIVGSTERFGW